MALDLDTVQGSRPALEVSILQIMIRWWRRKLRMIRYYSASRPHTAWTRAADVSLAVSMVLALPAVWFADRNVVWQEAATTYSGLLERDLEGELVASFLGGTGSLPPGERSASWGDFNLAVIPERHGFPLMTSESTPRPTLQLHEISGDRTIVDAELDADSPERAALSTAFRSAGSVEASEAYRQWSDREDRRVDHPWTWLASFAFWWVGLFVILSLTIVLTRVGTLLVASHGVGRRALLEAEGCCSNCGYDLRGLEMNERCPECGKLLH